VNAFDVATARKAGLSTGQATAVLETLGRATVARLAVRSRSADEFWALVEATTSPEVTEALRSGKAQRFEQAFDDGGQA